MIIPYLSILPNVQVSCGGLKFGKFKTAYGNQKMLEL